MIMKYLALDYESVKEIISNRMLQTAEFDNGKKLVDFIKKDVLHLIETTKWKQVPKIKN